MNFDHVNKVSDYTRDNLMPHLVSLLQVSDFGNYMSKLVDLPSCKWMRRELRAYPVNYFVDPAMFVKKYAEKCVTFIGTSSPQDGSMHIIYQISPTLHVLARLYNWVEHEKVRSYLMLTCAYRHQTEFLKFFDDNKSLRLTGNTEERHAGFGAEMQSSGIKNLMRGFSQIVDNEDDEESEDDEEDKA